MMPALTPNAWLRYDVIRRLLDTIEGDTFLEIGVGGGALGARLARRYKYVGYEPDAVSARTARKRLDRLGEVVESFLPEEPNELFHIAGAFEVLEHIEDDVAALRHWRRWLRDGGHLLMSVPANPGRWGPSDVRAGHIRRYTRSSVGQALESAGFTVVEVCSVGFPLGYVLEAGRHYLARRVPEPSPQIGTAESGRWLQPSDLLGGLTRWGTFPFRLMQRAALRSSYGTGLVVLARNSER